MNIKVLSYIDTESLNNKANASGTDDPNASTSAASPEASFSEVFDTAKKATAAVMIDKLVKESENGSVDCAVVQRFFDQYGINIQPPVRPQAVPHLLRKVGRDLNVLQNWMRFLMKQPKNMVWMQNS